MHPISRALSRRQSLLRATIGAALPFLPSLQARAQTRIEATLASVNGPDYINPRMQMVFIEKVKQRTNGGLAIKWVGNGQLGGLKENLEAIIAGNLEMCGVANANLGPLSPGPMLFDLPFVFRD